MAKLDSAQKGVKRICVLREGLEGAGSNTPQRVPARLRRPDTGPGSGPTGGWCERSYGEQELRRTD
jgi:hypothetical protein